MLEGDKKILNVSVYCVWQWWQEHYQKYHGRTSTIDFDWLDRTYFGRKKFLAEYFGHLGVIGSAQEKDYNVLSQVMPYHTMIIAVALGMNIAIQEVGGYAWQPMSAEQLNNLKAINFANSAVAEVILKHRQERLARYGRATQMIDIASVSNNAFMMRGAEFYEDLIVENNLAHHYLGVIKETMCEAYKFISEVFAPIEGFLLGNCNVAMMSPQLYDEMVLQYDVSCVEYAASLGGKSPCCDLHHCGVNTEPFAQSYSKIPGLRSLQGSYHSDIKFICKVLPHTRFSAMVSPVELLSRPVLDVINDIDNSIAAGANDLAIWDIDPATEPRQLGAFFDELCRIAENHNKQIQLDFIPITWEELAWEFPVYVRTNSTLSK
jgi:hypothetical protein